MFLRLIFNISLDHFCGHLVPYTPDKVSVTPQFTSPKLLSQLRVFLKHFSCRYTLQYLYHLRRRVSWWYLQEYVHMVFLYCHRVYPKPVFFSNTCEYLFGILSYLPSHYLLPVLWRPYQMILKLVYSVLRPPYTHVTFISPAIIRWQTFSPRLTASRFPPASKLAGIQRGSL